MTLPAPLLADAGATAVSLLREYFADDQPGYTGQHFERLGGGGDRLAVRDIFTSEDLVAVTMLSVRVEPRTAWRILVEDAETLSDLLRKIPTDLDLVDVDASDITPEWPAWQLWERLRAMYGIEWVIAGKLVARKRPRLVPVYDAVVQEAVQPTGSFWQALNAALRADDRALHRRLVEIRGDARVGLDVSALRVFDVVTWMSGTRGTRPSER